MSALEEKFKNKELRNFLIETGDALILEKPNYPCQNHNILGNLLMMLRKKLQSD